MSSLEKVPSEDTDDNEKTYGSSDEDSENGSFLMNVKLLDVTLFFLIRYKNSYS